jgi:hypothetical protein
MNTLEIAVLTLLVLSHPLPMTKSTLQALYILYMINAENEQKPGSEPAENAVQKFMITCNEKLRFLGITIETTDAEYHLTAISKTHEAE